MITAIVLNQDTGEKATRLERHDRAIEAPEGDGTSDEISRKHKRFIPSRSRP
jgi:hypothetical protein